MRQQEIGEYLDFLKGIAGNRVAKSKKGMMQLAPETPSELDIIAENRPTPQKVGGISDGKRKERQSTLPRKRNQVHVHGRAVAYFPYELMADVDPATEKRIAS